MCQYTEKDCNDTVVALVGGTVDMSSILGIGDYQRERLFITAGLNVTRLTSELYVELDLSVITKELKTNAYSGS